MLGNIKIPNLLDGVKITKNTLGIANIPKPARKEFARFRIYKLSHLKSTDFGKTEMDK